MGTDKIRITGNLLLDGDNRLRFSLRRPWVESVSIPVPKVAGSQLSL